MAKTLEAHGKLIREIFEGSYQFEIPDYQRPYAWTTEQATELFDDLYSAMQDARVSGASSQYFLGSIVLIKNDQDPKSSVVDGQGHRVALHPHAGSPFRKRLDSQHPDHRHGHHQNPAAGVTVQQKQQPRGEEADGAGQARRVL